MKPENSQQTRLAIVITLIALILVLTIVRVSGQCEPYKYGPYAKQELYIAPAIALVGTFVSVEIANHNGASVKQRDLTAFTGMLVSTGVFIVDYKIKQKKRRRSVRRIYGN